MRLRRRQRHPDGAAAELQRVEAIYDRLASRWNEREGRGERKLTRQQRQRLAAALEGDVLEVGIGTGTTLDDLASATARITTFTGIDLSTGMLAEATRAAEACPFPVTLKQMNAEALTAFADDTFDTVTSSLVLCTVPDPAAALREMARVCRPGGKLVLLEHVRAPNRLIGGVQKIVAPLQVRHLGCHLDRPTDRLVRDLGFAVERDEAWFFGIFHLMVARPVKG
jgi:ubiquinone/menaquinone biosynthesis C-methylase UbiE